MKRHTVARMIAVVLLSYAAAFMFVSVDKSNMAEYRSLSHEALLANLAKSNDGDFNSSFGESLLVIGLVVVLIQAITAIIEFAINRISPRHAPGATGIVTDVSESRFQ